MTRTHLSRRTLLRGAGASLALPLLDGMVPVFAQRGSGTQPVPRFVALYAAMGANMPQWTPSTDGAGFELSPTLQQLAPFRDQLLVMTGLDDDPAGNRPGDAGGIHSRSQSTWLTGVRAKRTDGPDFRVGTSMDQIAAKELGQHTQLTSLELTLEAGDVVGSCDYSYTCAYTSTLAWRTPTTPLPSEANPRAVFERLFGDADSTDPRARRARLASNASILDSLASDLRRLERRLTPRDRAKVSEYLDGVRDIERRIRTAEEQSERQLPLVEQPVGIPATYEDHARLLFDLLAMAIQTDLTRVATFTLARELSGRAYPEIGISEGHHSLSHHQNDPEKMAKQAKLNVFQLKQFAYFLQKLQSISDGDGSLLDHTLLLYGSGMSDSNLHDPSNLPTLVVGGKGLNVRSGRHVRAANGTPLANLHVGLLDRLGVKVETFGDSTGAINLTTL